MKALGYHIIYFDIDTHDYDNDSPMLIQNAKNNFANGIAGRSPSINEYLVIGHDIHNQTAHNLTAYMLETLLTAGYKPVTVGECLGDPSENWYRSSPGTEHTSSTAIATSTTAAPSVSATTLIFSCRVVVQPGSEVFFDNLEDFGCFWWTHHELLIAELVNEQDQ
ncbi:hypothetical protein LTR28_002528 [Elasticomyces elasticus]|nr:hypothetical protein LTR28_002528 [Elasticomyces elasticus]